MNSASDDLLAGELRGGEHRLRLRVYYEDTDFSGVVYHASFLRFMERGRTDYLRLLGIDHRALFEGGGAESAGLAFVVRTMTLEFLKPAYMDDVLEVVTRPREVGGASIWLDQMVGRGHTVLTTAQVRVACVEDGKAQRIPKTLRDALAADAAKARDL
jgi:acyl-CoA thioester hydrolase